MTRLSKHQWALLGVLYLRPQTMRELKVRWRSALRTVRACVQLGLVRTRGISDHHREGHLAELTEAGRQLIDQAAAANIARELDTLEAVAR